MNARQREPRALFPFGVVSTPRPPRLPVAGSAQAMVIGVYPSALHVRWTLPKWAVDQPLGLDRAIAALAVSDEPTVFWDGHDEDALVTKWQSEIGFVEGDDDGCDGRASAASNGTSGRAVRDDILDPLGIPGASVWFTDVVTRFFVKRGTDKRRGQADVIRSVYDPFAAARGREPATLPSVRTPSDSSHSPSTSGRGCWRRSAPRRHL